MDTSTSPVSLLQGFYRCHIDESSQVETVDADTSFYMEGWTSCNVGMFSPTKRIH